MVFRYKASNGKCYYLNETTSPKNNSPIRYFSREKNLKKGIELPKGYKVIESARTGMPILVKASYASCVECRDSFEQSRSNQVRCPRCQKQHRLAAANVSAKKFYARKAKKKGAKKEPQKRKQAVKKHPKSKQSRTIKRKGKPNKSIKRHASTTKKRGIHV